MNSSRSQTKDPSRTAFKNGFAHSFSCLTPISIGSWNAHRLQPRVKRFGRFGKRFLLVHWSRTESRNLRLLDLVLESNRARAADGDGHHAEIFRRQHRVSWPIENRR